MHGSAVVVGIGETQYYKRGEAPQSEFALACEAIRRAADDAGIDVRDIDGIVSYMDQRNPLLPWPNSPLQDPTVRPVYN